MLRRVHYLRACLSSTSDNSWRPLVRALVITVVQTNGLTLLTTIVNAILFLADENTAWVRSLPFFRARFSTFPSRR